MLRILGPPIGWSLEQWSIMIFIGVGFGDNIAQLCKISDMYKQSM